MATHSPLFDSFFWQIIMYYATSFFNITDDTHDQIVLTLETNNHSKLDCSESENYPMFPSG